MKVKDVTDLDQLKEVTSDWYWVELIRDSLDDKQYKWLVNKVKKKVLEAGIEEIDEDYI